MLAAVANDILNSNISLFHLLTTARQRCGKERQKQRRWVSRPSNSLHSLQLPLHIKHASTLGVIELLLKTHLYSMPFNTE